MPDFLRVTKPLVTQNQNSIQTKPGAESNSTFNIQTSTKVVQPHNQSEILKQNNGMTGGNDVPTLLLDLLKDPTVTVSYLQNIFMLEELYKLLPANNKTLTNDIEDVLGSLLTKPEYLTEEISSQQSSATAFTGGLFDFLREISSQNGDKPNVQIAIAKLLRSINSVGNQRETLDSVANNLTYLRSQLFASKSISEKLDELIAGFRAEDAQENFSSLKADALGLSKIIEDSILFTPSLGKTLSILFYNLSKYNSGSDYYTETVYQLGQLLTQPQRTELKELVQAYIDGKTSGMGTEAEGMIESHVMSSIVKLISQQSELNGSPADEMKLGRMIHSLLSSPCNFTPLLHFILPLEYNDMRAFAELWVNPDSDEKDMPEGVSGGMHLLMVIDVEGVGRFEAEFFVYDQTIDFSLYCPKGCEEGYGELMKSVPKLLYGTSYHVGKTKVLTFEETRSLMDVFKSLPYRRVGMDVKI